MLWTFLWSSCWSLHTECTLAIIKARCFHTRAQHARKSRRAKDTGEKTLARHMDGTHRSSLAFGIGIAYYSLSGIYARNVREYNVCKSPSPRISPPLPLPLIFKVPAIFLKWKLCRACTRWGVRELFFFLQMVSEQVNLIHETPAYGKIEKKC